MEFRKAIKAKQKLHLAIDGVSGSGKTFTSLAVASGIGGRIAVIDSEHASSELYADRFEFDVLSLEKFQVEDYINALNLAAENNYEIVIIDSTSHAWDALIERVERIANQRFNGNTFRAWAEGTPLQRKLIEAMLAYPGHIIVTCRSKTEYSVDKNDNSGKTIVKKVGTAAVQRQGFEYEFTMAMTMDVNHIGLITKDRTGKFQDEFIEKPGKKFGQDLIAWLNEGVRNNRDDENICQSKRNEVGRILRTLDAANVAVFTKSEIDAVREKLDIFNIYPADQRIVMIEDVLAEYKALLIERMNWPAGNNKPTSAPDFKAKLEQGNPTNESGANSAQPESIPVDQTPQTEMINESGAGSLRAMYEAQMAERQRKANEDRERLRVAAEQQATIPETFPPSAYSENEGTTTFEDDMPDNVPWGPETHRRISNTAVSSSRKTDSDELNIF